MGLLELTSGSGWRIMAAESVPPHRGEVRLRHDDAAVVMWLPYDKQKEHSTMAGHRQGRQQEGERWILGKEPGLSGGENSPEFVVKAVGWS